MPKPFSSWTFAFLATTLGAAACAVAPSSPFGDPPRPGAPEGGPTEPEPVLVPEAGTPVGPAFPKDPIVVPGAPSNAKDQFGGATPGSGEGPCLVEPELGALYPKNWSRPRFRWAPAQGETMFELRLHVANQPNDLVVYTAQTRWTMDAQIWAALREQSNGLPVTVSVRGLGGSSVYAGTKGDVEIAPVEAKGSVVYWTTSSASQSYDAKLKGFKIGDENVVEIFKPAQVSAQNKCVACHTSSPDGKFAGVNLAPSDGAGGWATADVRSVDGKATQAPYLTQAARNLLARPTTQLPVFTKGHYQQGDRVMGATYQNNAIIWIDLETQSEAQGTGWGVFQRLGDTGKPAMATFSRDGNTIAYTSTTDPSYGAGAIVRNGELRTIPWNGRAGGTSTPVGGSHLAGSMEFYPSFSPDDAYLAFTRAPADGTTSYDNAKAESFVVPASGGTAIRLAANDPPACTGAASPGITNSWPKWSPEVLTDSKGRKYYFLVFSSKRDKDANKRPQLYVSTLIVDGTSVRTTGALYLANQPVDESNHTPAWDVFEIPPVPVK